MVTEKSQLPASHIGTSQQQPTGGIHNGEIPNISTLVNSLRQDISHIKNQLQNLPPFPQGKQFKYPEGFLTLYCLL